MKCSFAIMNFLAHAYLSFNHPQILVGNMVSDFVKGKDRFEFSGNFKKGIELHRNIDEFTDTHPATKKAKEVFRPHYRLYSGAIIDILYDHFLANDVNEFADVALKKFTAHTYQVIAESTTHLPNKFLQAFTYMKAEDWLYNYKYKQGIQKSLAGMVRRAAYLSESETAYNLFLDHYVHLNECYNSFFPDVKQFAKQRFDALVSPV